MPRGSKAIVSITDNLRLEPKTIVLGEGQSVRIGSDVQVSRRPGREPAVQRRAGAARRGQMGSREPLAGGASGRATVPVGIGVGDKVFRTMIEVRPNAALVNGEVVIEPAKDLAPGQAEHAAGVRAHARGRPRRSHGLRRLPQQQREHGEGDQRAGLAAGPRQGPDQGRGLRGQSSRRRLGQVVNEEVTELAVNPSQLVMSVGDKTALQIFGQAPTAGSHEMFDQAELRVAPAKQGIVATAGNQVRALAPGQDAIEVAYRDKLRKQVQVSVGNNPYTDLRIEPPSQRSTPATP